MAEQPHRWYYPWVPLGLAACLVAGVVALFLISPSGPRAAAGEPTLEGPAGFQTTDALRVSVSLANPDGKSLKGELKADLVADDTVVSSKSLPVAQSDPAESYRFDFPPQKRPVKELKVRYTFGTRKLEVPLDKVLLVKAHETSLGGGVEFHAGSPASLRCEVRGVKSARETVPLPGASVNVRLVSAAGKPVPLYSGKADAEGVADVRFRLPDVPPGTYKMQIETRSGLGEEKLERDVTVKAEPKVLLVSDKPLYQPGQTMHLRALCLGAFDLKPVAGAKLVFEIEDSKSNKVFKKTETTTAHGIAAIDFQLATEVNEGPYRVRAVLDKTSADKTVDVKRYVLPKFKSAVTADKKFYMPKETIKADLQVDYFFGKPVAGGKVKVLAKTFDVAFNTFLTWEGKTDEQGHAKFEVKLPDNFVGQPIAKGNALVQLEVKVTDTADHDETITQTYPVSDQPIKVSLLPEAGRLVPGVDNRVFVAALYPDGGPAAGCDVRVWLKQGIEGKPDFTLKTGDSGLAEFVFKPKPEQLRADPPQQQEVEILGGKRQVWAPKNKMSLSAQAKDSKGSVGTSQAELQSEPFGENVLLRLDKAIYKGGEAVQIDVATSAGLPTVYLDVVRAGQTMLTQWLDVKDGKASHKLELPAEVFGTLEVHAYQMLVSGEILRDARVVYVNPASDLKVKVTADSDVYRPGADGVIRFEVTDSAGKPAPAALGVVIVDEAVYALQEMQPGLEKVYFTLQEELLKPQVQANFKPGVGLDVLVREDELPPARQQVAQALLTAVRPQPPARWEVNPALERRLKFQAQLDQVGMQLYAYAVNGNKVIEFDEKAKKWKFTPDVLARLAVWQGQQPWKLTDPLGVPLTVDDLATLDRELSADALARTLTSYRFQNIQWGVIQVCNNHQAQWFKNGKWALPDTVVAEGVAAAGLDPSWNKDAWGKLIRLVPRKNPQSAPPGNVLSTYELVSVGPDGKMDTDDDVRMSTQVASRYAVQLGGFDDRLGDRKDGGRRHWGRGDMRELLLRDNMRWRETADMATGARAAFPKADTGGPPPPMAAAPRAAGGGQGGAPGFPEEKSKVAELDRAGGAPASGGDAAPVRMREYFPETMLWRPALITNDKGVAELPVSFADSITTWRLTASASSTSGRLGGVTAPLRVFQDFFADLDLPVALTKNDEVAFPVAVYNYLKTPQKVTLELKREGWFELLEGETVRTVDLKAGEVAGVKFRIKARKVGHFPLTVTARGSKLSDAIKRMIEVVPDGQKVEQVFTDRLQGKVTQYIDLPDHADPDASKLLVKLHPGVFSQVLEGVDGMLRMPGGCFEQTSSSAYPNILVANYVKTAKLQNAAQVLMKAESFLNTGYQRLLTFERPGGGFDWWGSGEPLVWLSAYGLQEFYDMSKVWPVDPGVIQRTQSWLMRQMEPDGTWSKIGATHGESIERMGDAKLLLTSYVVWSLLESGTKPAVLAKSVAYIREHVKKADNAYILALAANALACVDPDDDSTLEVLKRLDTHKKELPEWKALTYPNPAGGHSLSYARGDSLTVETTALATLAMLKSRQFTNEANKALVYLVKSKDPHGTWGSTQATILALKALIAGAGGKLHKGTVKFAVHVNGKQAAEGEVTEANSDVMQLFDLKEHTKAGRNEVTIETQGESAMMYQVVARHYEASTKAPPTKPMFEVSVDYDRTRLAASDLLRAKATLKYNGDVPTSMVMLDLGIAPGFTVDAGDFAEMVGAKKVNKFTVTARQVTLYLGDVKPGQTLTFEYGLKAKYPVKAKAPAATAWEYYTPANRGESKPVELTVVDKK